MFVQTANFWGQIGKICIIHKYFSFYIKNFSIGAWHRWKSMIKWWYKKDKIGLLFEMINEVYREKVFLGYKEAEKYFAGKAAAFAE